jgi:riboflavin synthase
MFTGIVEALTKLEAKQSEGTNLHLTFTSPFDEALKIDQSVAHNGVCLTVVSLEDKKYTVTAIQETLERTNIGKLEVGDIVNLERCMKLGDRLDGHIVQGHVDTAGRCTYKASKDGSWIFRIEHPTNHPSYITVSKGSICINGISLTVVDSGPNYFTVAIIPYTHEQTNLQYVKVGDYVNLEFDIVGKYLAKMQGFGSEISK